MRTKRAVTTISAWLAISSTVFGIAPGQVDTFEDGTVMGWREGAPSSNPPTNVPDGGPAGPGDNYLQNISSGTGGSGGAMVMWNAAQWTGDYLAARTKTISFDAANLGNVEFPLAIAVQGAGGTWYGMVNPVPLPPDGQWTPVSFGLTDGELAPIAGLAQLSDVLATVGELRILSPLGGSPNFRGRRIAATLGVDNITAVVPLLGDADLDGDVDDNDLSLLVANWRQDATGDPDGGWGRGEFNNIAPIGDDDLSLLLANWTRVVAAATPEPATLALLALTAPALWRRRRRP